MLHTIFLIAFLIALAAKMADCITTYIGVDVKKVAVEGDPSAFTQWLAVRPWALFTVNPALFALMYLAFHYVDWTPAYYGGIALFALFAYRSTTAAIHNNKI